MSSTTKPSHSENLVLPSVKKRKSIVAPSDDDNSFLQSLSPSKYKSHGMYCFTSNSSLSPATIQENERLASLIKQLNSPSIGGNQSADKLLGFVKSDSGDEFRAFRVGLNRNFADLQKLIDIAKTGESREPAVEPMTNNILAPLEPDKKDKKKKSNTNQFFEIALNQSEDKKMLAGRKPIRVIAAELNKKLDELRNNPNQWEIFNARIKAFKAAQKMNRRLNAVQQNIESVSQHHLCKKGEILQHVRTEHEEHRRLVLENKKRLFEDKMQHLVHLVEKTGDEEKIKAQIKLNNKAAQHQHKWIILCALASRMWLMQREIEMIHQQFFKLQVKTRAAKVIQKAWREHLEVVYEKRKRNAISVIARILSKHIQLRRERKKHWAANVIRDFFKEIYDVSKLMKIIKKYRFSVIQAQRYVRQFLDIRQSQLLLLMLQWDKLEPVWWAQHRKSASPDKDTTEDETKSSKGKKTTKVVKDKESKKVETKMLKIPDEIRIPILLNELLCRRKAYRTTYYSYLRAMQEYNLQMKKKLEMDSVRQVLGDKGDKIATSNANGIKEKEMEKEEGECDTEAFQPPKKPLLKVLPPNLEMMQLIARGFLELSNTKAG